MRIGGARPGNPEGISLRGAARRREAFKRLPIRPRPMLEESTLGYFRRIALSNGHDSPRQLWSSLLCSGVTADHLLRTTLKLPRLVEATLSGPFPSYTRMSRETWLALRVDDFNHTELRWCPLCLAKSEYLRREWEIKLNCVCIRHSTILQDQCAECGERQPVTRGVIGRCRCGARLASAVVVRASTSLTELHRGLLQTTVSEPTHAWSALSPIQVTRLAKYFGSFALPQMPMRPGQISSLHRLNNALLIMNATASLLDEWPRRFYELLERLRDANRNSRRLGTVYGRLYRSIYHDLPDHGYHFLRTAFEAYLNDRWPGLLAKRNRRLRATTVTHHRMLPLRSLARITNASRATIKHLATVGTIDGTAINHKSGRTSWAFPQKAVAVAAERIADSMTLLEARKALGLTKRRVRELIDCWVVRAWVNPTRNNSATWSLSRKDVRAVLEMGSRTGHPKSDSDRLSVGLRQVLQTWQLRNGEFPSLVKAIRSGKLRFSRCPKMGSGIGYGRLDITELRLWISSHRALSRTTLSIDQAAIILGLKQQATYDLVRRGLLESVISTQVQERGRRITLDAIGNFKSHYVAIVEIARARGVGIRRLLKELPVAPVCGPCIDGARQYFCRRSDI
jgi:hypothetical protein